MRKRRRTGEAGVYCVPVLDPLEETEASATLGDLSPVLGLPPGAGDRLVDVAETDPDLDDVADRVVSGLLLHPDRRLLDLLPALQALSGLPLPLGLLKRRSCNVLIRAGVTGWSELATKSVGDLFDMHNTGSTTVRDILSVAVGQAVRVLSTSSSEAGPRSWEEEVNLTDEFDLTETSGRSVHQEWDPAAVQVLHAVRLLASWASCERGTIQLGDLLIGTTPGLPVDVEQALSSAGVIAVAQLAYPDLAEVDLGQLCEDMLDCLPADRRLVAERRLLVLKPDTLEQVGEALGLTRERARQIQLKAREQLTELLADDSCRPLRWRAATLSAALGAAVPSSSLIVAQALKEAAGKVVHSERLVAVLLYLAGPYRTQDGWMIRLAGAIPPINDLLAAMGSNRSISAPDAMAWLSSRGYVPQILTDWVQIEPKLRLEGDLLLNWSGSAIDKCVTLLQLWRRPASAEALVTGVGENHNVRSVRQRLFDDPRFMRVNRSEWVLREWGGEEYTGISEEIEQRILEWGGRAKLADLVDVLVKQFGVAAVSVRVYAEAPKFVIEDGWVRLRTAADALETRQTLPGTRGLYRRGLTSWAHVIHVDADVLRGSGRYAPEVLARALPLNPGEERAFESPAGSLRITWPITSAFGPSLGSTRALALHVGARLGDDLRIQFDLSSGTCEPVRVAPELLVGRDIRSSLQLLTGLELRDGELAEGVAEGVGTTAAELVGVLRRRGDDQVADLLPPPTDLALADALADLAALFDNE